MRTVLLACLVLAGCGRERPRLVLKDDEPEPRFPATVVGRESRITADELWDFYWVQQPFRTHPLEGKRILCKVTTAAEASRDAEGKPVLLVGYDLDVKQPRIVARLVWPVTPPPGGPVYIEGVLEGPAELGGSGWGEFWAKSRPQSERTAGYSVLIRDAFRVSPPKD